jgi:hypothetical protein
MLNKINLNRAILSGIILLGTTALTTPSFSAGRGVGVSLGGVSVGVSVGGGGGASISTGGLGGALGGAVGSVSSGVNGGLGGVSGGLDNLGGSNFFSGGVPGGSGRGLGRRNFFSGDFGQPIRPTVRVRRHELNVGGTNGVTVGTRKAKRSLAAGVKA